MPRYTLARMSLRSAAAHRNLLYLLSMKELRTRYKKSVLGWAWSLLNPLTQMVIFTVIFLVIFKAVPPIGDPSGLKSFPLYFLTGLLPFNFFAISVGVSMGAVQNGAGLIKKVQFPHEHLVFSVIVAQFVTLLIELVVLTAAMLLAGNNVLPWLPVLMLLLILLAVFTTGVCTRAGRGKRLLPRRQLPVGNSLADPVLRNAGDLGPGNGRIPMALANRQPQPHRQLHHRRPQPPVRPAPARPRPVGLLDGDCIRHLHDRGLDLQQALAELRRGDVNDD